MIGEMERRWTAVSVTGGRGRCRSAFFHGGVWKEGVERGGMAEGEVVAPCLSKALVEEEEGGRGEETLVFGCCRW